MEPTSTSVDQRAKGGRPAGVAAESRAKRVHSVRRARSGDLLPLSRTLSAAFADDPVARWLVPDDERYAHGAPAGFRAFLECVYIPLGETYLTADGSGAALWIPPSGDELTAAGQARLIARLVPAYGLGGVRRALRLLSTQDAHHPSEPHWYLSLLGTVPERQGEGVGAALIEAVTSRADADGVAAYLEATTERSAGLYARHGFEHREPFTVGGGGPTLLPMWREPR